MHRKKENINIYNSNLVCEIVDIYLRLPVNVIAVC